MPRYEYKVVPAPTKGIKGKGVRGSEARFSHAIQELMNGMAGYGWEYQRAETLPSVERSGLTGSTTEWRNVLVFRRLRDGDVALFQPELLPAPSPDDDTEPPQIDASFDADEDEDAAGNPNADTDTKSGAVAGRIGASLSILARARSATKRDAPTED
jgi:hypothetical protein